MKTYLHLIAIVVLTALLFGGCLTVEKKEYTFEFTGENSGILTIRYINIMTMIDDESQETDSAFEELISSYLYGDIIEEQYPFANVVSKRLYEEDDVLCAEVIIEFSDLEAVKLYQFSPDSYFLYALCQGLSSESYVSSNGKYGTDDVPVVAWPANMKKLELTTLLSEPDDSTVSLLPNFRAWQ